MQRGAAVVVLDVGAGTAGQQGLEAAGILGHVEGRLAALCPGREVCAQGPQALDGSNVSLRTSTTTAASSPRPKPDLHVESSACLDCGHVEGSAAPHVPALQVGPPGMQEPDDVHVAAACSHVDGIVVQARDQGVRIRAEIQQEGDVVDPPSLQGRKKGNCHYFPFLCDRNNRGRAAGRGVRTARAPRIALTEQARCNGRYPNPLGLSMEISPSRLALQDGELCRVRPKDARTFAQPPAHLSSDKAEYGEAHIQCSVPASAGDTPNTIRTPKL